MPGLDLSNIGLLDLSRARRRIQTDVVSDFILAPHYSAIYEYAGADIEELTLEQLKSGKFSPSLPFTIDVPKSTGSTRPGSILQPVDRMVYQAMVDAIAPQAELASDPTRSFAYRLLDPDPEDRMFWPSYETWGNFQSALTDYSEADRGTFVLKADIASYFECINQHTLVNLLASSGCEQGIIRLLEDVLAAWSQRQSRGILQGLFPSDFLGTLFLCTVDANFAIRDLATARYVDDLYLFCDSRRSAQKELIELCRHLREVGLFVNEYKTRILNVSSLKREETMVDELFRAAREQLEEEANSLIADYGPYGFRDTWQVQNNPIREQEIEIGAIEALFESRNEFPDHKERIEKFCLPVLGMVGSDSAIDAAIEGIIETPHLAQVYCSYLAAFSSHNSSIRTMVVDFIRKNETNVISDWQLMWTLGVLLSADSLPTDQVQMAERILHSRASQELRGLSAIVIGKHGNAPQKSNLRASFSNEQSEYVRSAILYAARYFPTAERKTCFRAWGTLTETNVLITKAVTELIKVG